MNRRRTRGEQRRYRRALVAVSRDSQNRVEPAPGNGTGSATRTANSKEQHA